MTWKTALALTTILYSWGGTAEAVVQDQIRLELTNSSEGISKQVEIEAAKLRVKITNLSNNEVWEGDIKNQFKEKGGTSITTISLPRLGLQMTAANQGRRYKVEVGYNFHIYQPGESLVTRSGTKTSETLTATLSHPLPADLVAIPVATINFNINPAKKYKVKARITDGLTTIEDSDARAAREAAEARAAAERAAQEARAHHMHADIVAKRHAAEHKLSSALSNQTRALKNLQATGHAYLHGSVISSVWWKSQKRYKTAVARSHAATHAATAAGLDTMAVKAYEIKQAKNVSAAAKTERAVANHMYAEAQHLNREHPSPAHAKHLERKKAAFKKAAKAQKNAAAALKALQR